MQSVKKIESDFQHGELPAPIELTSEELGFVAGTGGGISGSGGPVPQGGGISGSGK